MDTIHLSDNHSRVLATALLVVEKSILDFERLITVNNDSVFRKTLFETELTGDKLNHYLAVIAEAKNSLHLLFKKYNLKPTVFSFDQVLNSMKSSTWQTLSDTNSKRMRRYGSFPPKHASELDTDIDQLLKLLEKL